MDNPEQPSRPSDENRNRKRRDVSVPRGAGDTVRRSRPAGQQRPADQAARGAQARMQQPTGSTPKAGAGVRANAGSRTQANARQARRQSAQASQGQGGQTQPIIDVVPVEASRRSERASHSAHSAHSTRAAGVGAAASEHAARTTHGGKVERSAHTAPNGESLVRVRKKKKSRRGLKIALIVVAVIIALLLMAGAAVALYINSLNSAISYDDPNQQEQLQNVLDTPEQNQPYYVLVLGSDAREGDTASRSDVIMLARVAPGATSSTITLVSIPRDTMVELPGYGTSKINAAYAYGGAAGAVEAVENFAGVNISHVVEIHFQELETLIDSLGGVWVDVPIATELDSGTLEAGDQLLNGTQALEFVRERYSYARGDFQRSDNQRLVAEAIIRKVLDVSPLELPGTIQQLATCVTTDLDVGEIVELVQEIQQSSLLTFYSCMAPSTTATIDGVSYAITIDDEWEEMMRLVDEGADPSAASANVANAKAAASTAGTSGTDAADSAASAGTSDPNAASGSM